eukprot:scaffold11323_cov111-Isochrysis_galbana.AAC.5
MRSKGECAGARHESHRPHCQTRTPHCARDRLEIFNLRYSAGPIEYGTGYIKTIDSIRKTRV